MRIVLILLAVIVLIGFGVAVVLILAASKIFKSDYVNLFGSTGSGVFVDASYYGPSTELWDAPFEKTGAEDLEHSIRLSGKAWRWQSSHVEHGKRYYRMFEDGDWKWNAKGRFAGEGLNCGHYFGLSIRAASEEAGHYGTDTNSSTLVEIECSIDRILDLTHPDVVKTWFERYVEDHEVVSHSYYKMFQELIEQCKGGNGITDYFGLTAKRLGYDGIRFFSARVLSEWATYNFNRNLEGSTVRRFIWERRGNPENLNVMFFSGTSLIGSITWLQIGDDARFQNPYRGKDSGELYGMFDTDVEARDEEGYRFTLTRPRYRARD